MATTEVLKEQIPQAWLVLPKVVEILSPGGEYTRGRLALRKEHGVVLENAKKVLAINSAEEAETATGYGRLLQAATGESATFYKGFKQQIDAIKAPVLSDEHQDVDAYEAEKKRLGGLLTMWNRKVREEQEAEERKAREEAVRKAQEEQLLRAIEVESIEGTEAGEAVLQEPLMPLPSVPLSRSFAKPKGSVAKVTYTAQVDNPMELLKAIVDGKVPINAIEINQSWLNTRARSDMEAFSIPGCRLKKDDGTHFRS